MLLAVALCVCLPQEQEPAALPRIRATVVTGAGDHDWQWTSQEIARALEETGRFRTEVVDDAAGFFVEAPERATAHKLHLIVLDYAGPRWGDAADDGFLATVGGGVGVVFTTAACRAFGDWPEYARLCGLVAREGARQAERGPFDVHVVDPHHPVTRGVADLCGHPDAPWFGLSPARSDGPRVLLAAFREPGGPMEPVATIGRYGDGRLFQVALGDVRPGDEASRASWLDPNWRRLFARGCEWAATGRVTLATDAPNVLGEEERAEGFRLLFDGRTLDGWRQYLTEVNEQHGWSVRDGAIVCAKTGGPDLVTAAEFGDFDFRFSFRIASGGNSGVLWHVQEIAPATFQTGPEYQVLDDAQAGAGPLHGTGALYDLVPTNEAPVRPAGQWNEGRIVVHKGRVQHWLNGKCVVDVACRGPEWDALVAGSKFRDWPFARAASGRLALQDHGSEVAYRNLRVKDL
jgi:type 1 glutamine amidotransferase